MWHAADIADKLRHAAEGYEFTNVESPPKFDWKTFKPRRDAYIKRLNTIYDGNVQKDGVEWFHGNARLISSSEVEVTPVNAGEKPFVLKATNIVIATGGRPTVPSESDVPGASYGITSDGFFELAEQPKRVAVAGAGYIAVELAGVLNTLGSETSLIYRGETVLRTFDPSLQDVLTTWMGKTGVNMAGGTQIVKVERRAQSSGEQELVLHLKNGKTLVVDVLIWAIGRHANTENLGLEKLGVKLDEKGNVIVDEYQETGVQGIIALGDVAGKALLTPVAIAAGRRASNRLFGGDKYKGDKVNYDDIATVVFS